MIGTTRDCAIWIAVQALEQAFVAFVDRLASHFATEQYIAKWGPIIAESQQTVDLPERAGTNSARYAGVVREPHKHLQHMSWEQQQRSFAPARFESLAHHCSSFVCHPASKV